MSLPQKKYGIYIHIPFCKSKCAYCSFVSVTDFSLQKRYVERLISEIEQCSCAGARVDTVYIGGGTPSCLYHGAIAEILGAVRNTFDIDRDCEITSEANPESCTVDFAEECLNSGVNRISMGLQSSDDKVLSAIGRLHTADGFVRAVRLLRKVGFANVSSDLILGLKGQTADDIVRSVDIMTEYCEHASVYALTVESGTPLCRSGYMPDDDLIADMYDIAYRRLTENGFFRYEVSNFAKSGRQSRHNTKYWNCDPYIGFGAAAHSYDGERVRARHTDSVADYIEKCEIFEEILTDADRYNEYIMLALRTEKGISREKFRAVFGYDFCARNAEKLKFYEKIGAVCVTHDRVRIAPQKMFVMNGIIEDFMM